MKATEIFLLFLKKGLEPNERLALTNEIRVAIRTNKIFKPIYWNDKYIMPSELEKIFVEKLIRNTRYTSNTLGNYGDSSSCTCLTSFMKYLLYYVPSIVGNSRNKNRFLARVDAEIPSGKGYKRYWELRLI